MKANNPPKRFLFPEPHLRQVIQKEPDDWSSSNANVIPNKLTINYTGFLTRFSFKAANPQDLKLPTPFDVGVFVAETFHNLNSLSLAGAAEWLDDHFVYQFVRLGRIRNQITSLTLCRTSKMSTIGLTKCLNRFKKLTELNLEDLSIVNDGLLTAVSSSLRNLHTLRLHACPNLSHNGISKLLECSTQLQALEISGCPNVSDSIFSSLAALENKEEGVAFVAEPSAGSSLKPINSNGKGCNNISLSGLKSLTISSPGNALTVEGLLHYIQANHPCLIHLEVSKTSQLTDAHLGAIAVALGSTLRILSIRECDAVTKKGLLTKVCKYMKKLEGLDIRFCSGIEGTDSRKTHAIDTVLGEVRKYIGRNIWVRTRSLSI